MTKTKNNQKGEKEMGYMTLNQDFKHDEFVKRFSSEMKKLFKKKLKGFLSNDGIPGFMFESCDSVENVAEQIINGHVGNMDLDYDFTLYPEKYKDFTPEYFAEIAYDNHEQYDSNW